MIAGTPTGVPQLKWVSSIPNNGLIRYKGLLNQERVLVTSAKAISEVLVTKSYDFKKPGQIRFTLGRILGVGILLAEGDEHKLQRRNLMPAFAFRHIKDLYPVFWDKGREGVQALTEYVLSEAAKTPAPQDLEKGSELDGKTTAVVEVGSWASRMTLDIIGVAGLGRDFGAIRDTQNPLFKTYNHLFKPSRQAQILTLMGLVFPGWLISAIPVKRNEDIAAAAKVIRSTCRDLIREKKHKLERKELTDVDILSVALESGGFTEDNLVDQLMTFLAAGHETTASSMTWATYLLSRYPEIQTRLREEVRSNLPSLNDAASISSLDIDHLPYLNAVCSEVLRYWSPVPMTMRETAVETTIEGQKIPKGTRIILSPAATNKDVHLWGPDALTFNPDRWIPKFEGDKQAASGGASSNYAFLTFLHGPRSCIGMSFARAEFACLLAAWVGRFEFSLKNKEEMDETKIAIKGGITSRPAKGLYVYAKVLDGW
ncbi:putative cytochrome p450 97b3 protein [Phaeoacremonium minimum UCRPA7]|uniref:Putative cytochrome p450 97b3 protein n=1 Tax=Phaeoacremonium minimum (strain UCR-PA7) TaxID=1286976 RepID=R8BBX6_PHAM7|nr:putative cytochrome p450 97b3 protein [Phaeoacremonium minimum UCRPA7]EON96801.1 putative cytochrome p450 97b3 protein [Phaeoacremonium minimum UCRPA7]